MKKLLAAVMAILGLASSAGAATIDLSTVKSNLTLVNGDTITGTGTLIALNNGRAAGIGGGYGIACGSISIDGGTVIAVGGEGAAEYDIILTWKR